MNKNIIYEEVQSAKLFKIIAYIFLVVSLFLLFGSIGLEEKETFIGSIGSAIV